MAPRTRSGPPPLAEAMRWVSRITTIVLEMVLPAVVGHWLDGYWGTQFLGLAGMVLGPIVGFVHLLHLAREVEQRRRDRRRDPERRAEERTP